MKDRTHETGQDKAERESSVVSKVRIDPEVARALGAFKCGMGAG